MCDHLAGRVPVRHDDSSESPLISQHVLYEPFVTCRRNAVVGIEGSHQGHRSGIDTSLESRKIDIPKRAFRDFRSIVVPSSFGCTVSDKVLDTSGDGGGISVPLVSAHHCGSHHGIKVRVLSGAFGNPSPARVAGDVQHRGECPPDSVGRGYSGYAGSFFHQFRVECRCQSKRYREYGLESVNDVPCYEKRNTEAALFNSDPLYPVQLGRIGAVEDASHFTFFHGFSQPFSSGQLVHLPDFLVQGHLRDEPVDLLFRIVFGGAAGDSRQEGYRYQGVYCLFHILTNSWRSPPVFLCNCASREPRHHCSSCSRRR